jgi:hypothetical protein
MSAEELKALEGEALAVDALTAPAPTPDQQAEAAQAAPNEAAEIAALLQIMAGLAAPLFPSLAKIYTAETCNAIGQAAAPVMAKHGWSTGTMLGKYAEELALLAVVAPIGFATWQGVQADVAAAKAKAKKDDKPQEVIAEQVAPSEPWDITKQPEAIPA